MGLAGGAIIGLGEPHQLSGGLVQLAAQAGTNEKLKYGVDN